jgi:hypothetical protein
MKLGIVTSLCCVLWMVFAPGQATATEATPDGLGSGYDSAGYAVAPQAVTTVSAHWVVPVVTCPRPAAAVTMSVAMQESPTRRFVRLGTDVDCHQGRPRYGAWIRLPGSHRALLRSDVHPGDDISARLYVDDRARVGATLSNGTQGYILLISTNAHLSPQRALVLVGKRPVGQGFHALADFGKIRFTRCSVNHHIFGHNLSRLSMRSRTTGERLVRPGVFTRPSGSFEVEYR